MQDSMENLPEETIPHIQSAGCTAQSKRVIGAHNKCLKYLLVPSSNMGRQNEISNSLGKTKTDNWIDV